MTDIEMLPCPFCGGAPELAIKGNVRSTRKCVVRCTECRYQRVDAALRYGDDWLRSTAAAAWNRRVAKQPAAVDKAMVERALLAFWGKHWNADAEVGADRAQEMHAALVAGLSCPRVGGDG